MSPAYRIMLRNHQQQVSCQQKRRGVVLPLFAVLLPVLIILAAFLLNISYLELAETELQISADASARAGGRTLADTGDTDLAIAKAQQIAALNSVAGKPLALSSDDIEFGQATRVGVDERYVFMPTVDQFNSIRVHARRDQASLDGPISLFLPSFLGISEVSLASSSISTQVDLDISIVIDRSGSMAYADNENSNTFDNPAAAPAGWVFGDPVPTPSRWIDAEKAVESFLVILQGTPQREFVSLITYGDDASLDVPLTENYSFIVGGMRFRGSSFPEALTNIGSGIALADSTLATDPGGRKFASKVILVLTDGIHNLGMNPDDAARAAADNDTTVFTITFSAEADQDRMRGVAQLGSGRHFHAASAAQLVVAFEEIARSLPTLIVE